LHAMSPHVFHYPLSIFHYPLLKVLAGCILVEDDLSGDAFGDHGEDFVGDGV
jgi:hypothetical protein